MTGARSFLLLVLSVATAWTTNAFVPVQLCPFDSCARSTRLSATTVTTTLTEETTWDLRFLLKAVPTDQGKKVDEIFSAKIQFIEEMGYEPPQGTLKQVESDDGRFQIVSSRWKLSEDPNERKDGLWVWGLFAEPLYPFMLLQLELARIPLPGEDEDAIQPLKLYAQLNHQRQEDVGVILSGADLTVKVGESIGADPFGAAKITLYDDVTVGNLQIQPPRSQ